MLLAVSGGSDSVALMHLAAPLAADGHAMIGVATVDHGLRAEARREAETVGDAARALNLPHEILVWSADKPSSGLQAAARTARYGLLVRHAEIVGAEAIVTAHTADDQAETVLMRLARGSGTRGLSGMAEKSLIAAGPSQPITLVRPLLTMRRAALRDYLSGIAATFIDDPSNEDRRFERVRVRRLLADPDAQLSVAALVETAKEMRAAAERIEAFENARFEGLEGRFSPLGDASLADALTLDDCGLVARLIAAVGGADFPPNTARAADILAAALAGRPATIGGVLLVRRADRLVLSREAAAVLGRVGVKPLEPVRLSPGERTLWDGRFIVENRLGVPAILRPLRLAEARTLGASEPAEGAPALFVGEIPVATAGVDEGFEALASERFYRRVNRFP